MNKVLCIASVLFLVGCDVNPDWRKAAENYAEDTCKGKLLSESVGINLLDGTIKSRFYWSCIEDKGVVSYQWTIDKIPAKYWYVEE